MGKTTIGPYHGASEGFALETRLSMELQMGELSEKQSILHATDIAAQPFDYHHPLVDTAKPRMFALSRMAGLKSAGVNLIHLDIGLCSFPAHRHHNEEEWIYILSGLGTLALDGVDHPIEAGDFAAFQPHGPAHKLTNTGTEPLIYLTGGDNLPSDIIDFPELNKRLLRSGHDYSTMEIASLDAFCPYDAMSKMKHAVDD